MVSIRDVLKNVPKEKLKGDGSDIMTNPDYLRKSSDLIKDSLQKGFDVLQLDNGDIVTTGTKVIVTTWKWDSKAKKMMKGSSREKGTDKPTKKKK